MENNEIMNNNEEVIETTTEEIVKAASNGGMKIATTIGLAMIAGALTYKFVVVPATAKFKNWRENRKTVVTQPKGDIVDGEFTDIDEDTVEYYEYELYRCFSEWGCTYIRVRSLFLFKGVVLLFSICMMDRLWSLIPALQIDGRVLHTRHPKRKPGVIWCISLRRKQTVFQVRG